MNKFLLVFLLMPLHAYSADINHSVGAGLPHAVVGYQFSVVSDAQKYYTSIFIWSYSVGFEFPISENNKNTIGLSYTRTYAPFSPDEYFKSINYNHYFNGLNKKGWFLGASLAIAEKEEEIFDESEEETEFSLSYGYVF